MHQQWIKTGSACGMLGIICYLLAAFAPIPDSVGLVLVLHFGILLAIGYVGLFHFFVHSGTNGLGIHLMKYAAIIAGATVTAMLTVQQAFFMQYARIMAEASQSSKHIMMQTSIKELLNTVHFGLDISWDIFISWAGMLLGIALYRSTYFSKVVGLYFFGIHLLLIVFNLYTFPTPPDEMGLIDMGPFISLSYLVLFGYMWLKFRKAKSVDKLAC